MALDGVKGPPAQPSVKFPGLLEGDSGLPQVAKTNQRRSSRNCSAHQGTPEAARDELTAAESVKGP